MSTLTPVEIQVMTALLSGDNAVLPALQGHYDHIEDVFRDMTGVGFFTNLVLSKHIRPLLGRPSFEIGDVDGTATNVQHGVGFVLFIRDGFLSALEGYTYDEPWPSRLDGLRLTYSGRAMDSPAGKYQRYLSFSGAVR